MLIEIAKKIEYIFENEIKTDFINNEKYISDTYLKLQNFNDELSNYGRLTLFGQLERFCNELFNPLHKICDGLHNISSYDTSINIYGGNGMIIYFTVYHADEDIKGLFSIGFGASADFSIWTFEGDGNINDIIKKDIDISKIIIDKFNIEMLLDKSMKRRK